MMKHSGRENGENDHKIRLLPIFKRILPTCLIRNRLTVIREESVHVHTGLKGSVMCIMCYFHAIQKMAVF